MDNSDNTSRTPNLPVSLQREIVDFLTSLPTVHGTLSQQALINSAGLDAGLMRQITFPGSTLQFFQLLVPLTLSYGRLEDGRHPLYSVLEAARNTVGTDRRNVCDRLMQELQRTLTQSAPAEQSAATEEHGTQSPQAVTSSETPSEKPVAPPSTSPQPLEELPMSTIISQRQNEPHQIQRLKAQRYLYDQARRWKGYRKIVTIPVAFVLAVLLTLLTRNDVWVALAGVVLTIVDLFGLRRQEHTLRREAASIQELFDCDVLQLDQNRALLGIPPASDDIASYAREYDPSKYPNSPLENWYSVKVDQLPLYLARLVCQRANLTWDQRLRYRHVNTIIRDAVLLAMAIAAGGVVL